jgi:hypothetical protein
MTGYSKLTSAFLISSALAILPASADTSFTNLDILAIENQCEGIRSFSDAAACTQPVYEAAMSQSDEIWHRLHNSDSFQPGGLEGIKKDEYSTYQQTCLNQSEQKLKQADNIPEYMLKAQYCLSVSTRLADDTGLEYNRNKAGYLINKSRRLRQLSISPD